MKTILVVDDEPNLRRLVATTLGDTSHRVLEAADGDSALGLVSSHKPDVILLDWMMPGLTGLQVAQSVRADPSTREIPIIMLTAKGQERDRAAVADLGLAGYLVKPFSPLELIDRVRAALE